MAALCNQRPEKPVIITIGGPTATGKTALSIALAQHFRGEIISADSMQVYRGLDIGTAKATDEERGMIPHHLVDILEPETPYSVANFTEQAAQKIEELTTAGKLPLLVGGTGLYMNSLLNGIAFAPQPGSAAVRAKLQQQSKQTLYARLEEIDPAYAAKVHPNNLPRVIRALELFETTGRRMSEAQPAARAKEPPYRALCLALTCRDRAVLYERINRRVDGMVAAGVLPEAERVWNNRTAYTTAAQAIGYKEFFPYFEGAATLEACIEKLKQNTRNYAKRQLTWFRNQQDAVWLYVDEADPTAQAKRLVEAFLQQVQ